MQIAAAFNSSIELDQNFTVNGLTQDGSSYTGTGSLTLNGTSALAGNVTDGSTGALTVASGTTTLSGGRLTVGQGGLTVNNNTTFAMAGGTLSTNNGARITNNGNFFLQGNNLTLDNGPGANAFVNNANAVFQKSRTLLADISQINIPFTNNGTVQAQTGVISFNNTFTMNQAQAVINVQASGSGEVRASQLTVSAGQLQGDGILRVTGQGGQGNWQAAQMTGSGKVIVDVGATLSVLGAFTDSGFTINNSGTVSWNAGDITLNNGSTINNQPGALFQAVSNNSITNTAGAATFNNYGSFEKIPGVDQPSWTILAVPFNSTTQQGQPTSQVKAIVGLIRLRSNTNIQGTLRSAAGAEVDFDGGAFTTYNLLDGTTLTATGTIRITNSSTLTIAAGAKVVSSGVFDIGGGIPVLQGTLVGFLTGNGVFQNQAAGTTNWRRGQLLNLLQFQNQGTLNIISEDPQNLPTLNSSLLTNTGTIAWTGGDMVMTRSSEINNLGTFDIQNGATLQSPQINGGKDFLNQGFGILKKSAGQATTIQIVVITSATVDLMGRAVSFTGGILQNGGGIFLSDGSLTTGSYSFNSGTVNLGNNGVGTLNVAAGITVPQGSGNVLSGVGTINGNVTNDGTTDIGFFGAPVGTMTINGNYTQSATATLKIRLQAAMGNAYDSLTITGTANLAGNLVVVAFGGFNPAAGDQFTILSYQACVGDFNRPYNLPALNAPRVWAPAAPGNNSLVLTVQ